MYFLQLLKLHKRLLCSMQQCLNSLLYCFPNATLQIKIDKIALSQKPSYSFYSNVNRLEFRPF